MMNCYSERTCALAVDGELPTDEAQRLREHLAKCQRCRDLVDALRAENRVLGESLQELPEEVPNLAGFYYPRRFSIRGDLAMMAAILTLGSVISVWINQVNIPAALDWLNPFSLSGQTNLMFDISYYLVNQGRAMLTDYAAAVGLLSLLVLLGGAALLFAYRGQLRQSSLRLLIVLLAFSLPSFGLERRHSDTVNVGANETIDDTLVAAGNTVHIDGVINGDLLAFARSVEVRGTVKGDVVSFAKRTVVSGTVEGRIYSFAQALDVEGDLGHSIYGFAQSLRVSDRSHVGDGIVAAAGDVSIDGDVKRSVDILASGNADVSGSVGRDLTMAGRGITLTNTARVGGNLIARVRELNNVHIAEGATIAGKRDIEVRQRKSPFSRPRFYFHQAIWFAAALLVGWLGLVLFPGFPQATTHAVGSGWTSVALGIAILAGVPVVVIVVAITLIGLPIALMLFATYLAALYLAKIWVGAFLGRIILKPSGASKRDWMLGLLLGLFILTVIGFIPYFGGLVRFGVLCLGLGAFALQLYRSSRPAVTA